MINNPSGVRWSEKRIDAAARSEAGNGRLGGIDSL